MTSRTDLHPDTLPDPHRRKLGRLLVVTAAGGSSLLALTSGARAQSLEKKKVTIAVGGRMILVEKTLGNVDEPEWHRRAHGAHVDVLTLEQWEAPKSRLRKATEGGLELAISLPRSQHLHDGDVLHVDEARNVIVVAKVPLKEVLVIEMEGLEKLAALLGTYSETTFARVRIKPEEPPRVLPCKDGVELKNRFRRAVAAVG